MARGGNWRGTEHEKQHTCVCVWCGLVFRSSRDLAKTCSDAHRHALSRYVKRHGKPPEQPPAHELKPE